MPVSEHVLRRFAYGCLLACLLCVLSATVHCGETDQYLTWEAELTDSAPAFNAYLNEEIQVFVDKMNRRNRKVNDATELTVELYRHLFAGLHASRVRKWLNNNGGVERFPSDDLSDWEYQQQSIFRAPAFPFLLPMAQTIRVGDVYFGIDKIGHMFGFGRRYLQRYHRYREAGDTHEGAMDRVLTWGVRHELGLVGKLVDGIFSHGDLEANYQGFRLARTFCAGESPLFHRIDGIWHYRGGLDMRDYITPDFDETFNPNDYARWRERRVLPVVQHEYDDLAGSRRVEARFARYRRGYEASRSKQFVDAWFSEHNKENPAPLARN